MAKLQSLSPTQGQCIIYPRKNCGLQHRYNTLTLIRKSYDNSQELIPAVKPIMKNGFIYPTTNIIIRVLCYLNLVELFKYFAKRACKEMYGTNEAAYLEKVSKYAIHAIDFFQIFKWSVLLLFWFDAASGKVSEVIIWYGIASNLFTYFYYHVWGSDHRQIKTRESMNRRFTNTILAIFFYMAAYAYLYEHHYSDQLVWADNIVDSTHALYLSIANSFTLTYEGFCPKSQTMRVILISQVINTFMFFTIIISNAIPNHFKEEKNEL